MRTIAFIFLILSVTAQAQISKRDTTPVWVVYLDSVRVFAAYPGVDMRTEVVAGWKVSSKNENDYYDTSGVKFDPDMVLLTKPRKVTPNPFRQ